MTRRRRSPRRPRSSMRRRLPMPLGPAEAAVIDRRLHPEAPSGPHLEELASASIDALGGRVLRASIESMGEGKTFFGHLTVRGAGGTVELESRAADAVAL